MAGDCSLYKLVGTNQPEMEGKFVLLVDSVPETGIINKFRLAFQFPETAEFCLVAKANTVCGEEFRSAESFSRLTIHTLPDQRGEPWRIMGTAATVEKFLEQSQSLHESPAAVETYSAIIFSEPPEEVPPKPYPTMGQALVLLLLYLAVQTLSIIPILIYDEVFKTKWSGHPIFLGLVLSNAAYWTIRYALRRTRQTWSVLFPKRTIVGYTLPTQVACGVGLLMLVIEAATVVMRLLPDVSGKLLKEGMVINPWALFVTLVVVAPIAEEALFRGIMLPGFLQRYSKWKAIALVSLLFGIMHLNPAQSFLVFFFGLLSGWYYTESRDIWTCVAGHAINNGIAVAFMALALSAKNVPAAKPEIAWYVHLLILGAGSALLWMGMVQFRQAVARSREAELELTQSLQ